MKSKRKWKRGYPILGMFSDTGKKETGGYFMGIGKASSSKKRGTSHWLV
jgi:hypothetical protein